MCLEHCTGLGAAFMGTQHGFECWCSPDGGLDYTRHDDIIGEAAVCDMNCLGDEVVTTGYGIRVVRCIVAAAQYRMRVENIPRGGGERIKMSPRAFSKVGKGDLLSRK